MGHVVVDLIQQRIGRWQRESRAGEAWRDLSGWRGAVSIRFLILPCTTDVLRVQLSRGLLQSAGRAGSIFQSRVPLSALCHVSLTQDYELEAEKLRSLLDLEHGRSSHVSKRARLQSPAAKVREEVSPVVGPC